MESVNVLKCICVVVSFFGYTCGFGENLSQAVDILRNLSQAEEVYERVFMTNRYNAKIRPVLNDSQTLPVKVYMELLSIHDLDEKSETFKFTVYMNLAWVDEYLRWNQSTYDVTSLTYSQSDIWTPELVLTNSFERYQNLGDEHLKLMVAPDGTVTWETIEVLTSTCKIDTTYFPFDIQTCDINFVVWNYFREDVRLVPHLDGQETGLHEFESHPGWEILSWQTSKGDLRKSSITFSVTLKRKAEYYIQNYVLPTVMLTVLNLMTFILPHDCGERASYSVTVFLSMVVMQTILNSVLPESSNMCIFTLYLIIETGLSTAMTIINIVLIRMANFSTETPIPTCLKSFVKCCCRKATISPMENEKAEKVENDVDSMMSQNLEERAIDWQDVVRALDKLCFVGFLTVSCIVTFVTLYICAMAQMVAADM